MILFLVRNIATDNIRMFDDSIDPIFDIQTLNHKPKILDPIDAFGIR
jgi:hypothetical protein